jgi:hypothetical protein
VKILRIEEQTTLDAQHDPSVFAAQLSVPKETITDKGTKPHQSPTEKVGKKEISSQTEQNGKVLPSFYIMFSNSKKSSLQKWTF